LPRNDARISTSLLRLFRRCCFALVVLPLVNFHLRVFVFMGRFTCPAPSQAGQTRRRPSATPTHGTTSFLPASCEALYKERIEASGVGLSLLASEGDFGRFKQCSRILHISCFTHNLRYALPWSSRFAPFQYRRFKGRPLLFSGLP
jgi:hypothetical protein